MKKLKKIVIGNWKMNPQSLSDAKEIARSIKNVAKSIKKTQVVICPPFIYISPLSTLVSTTLFLGSQDAYFEPFGSFTGEVSYSQLHQFKTSFVIIGHSERRKMGENDDTINKKVISVTGDGMTAILCVGEDKRDDHGNYLSHVRNQIFSGLKNVSKKLLHHIVVAYEPVWAIGASEAMQPRDVHEMTIFIRKTLRDMFGPLSDSIRIIYGGSVNEFNTKDIIEKSGVNGFLVGRDSLKPKSFAEIIKTVEEN